MKTTDIVIKEKCIVLGIFDTLTFSKFTGRRNEIKSYVWFDDVIMSFHYNSVIENVELAAEWADQIIFVLDDVRFPIDPERSITCKELALICQNDLFFNKTIFVKEDNVIEFDKNLI